MDVPDILNLPNLEVLNVNDTESPYDYYITAESSKEVNCCQVCGSVKDSAIVKIGKRQYVYYDIPISGRRVVIKVNRQRYKCRECGSVFAEALPDMDDKRNATKRLVKWIEERSLIHSFTSVADDVGVDEKTVRNIFKDYSDRLDRKRKRVIPKVMGVDEIYILGKRRFVITNIEERTILDMLPSNDTSLLEKYFGIIVDRHQTKFITMDMYAPYRKMCQKMFPEAQIVVDKWHILKSANYALDMTRKRFQTTKTDKERRKIKRSRFLLQSRKELSDEQLKTLNSWLEGSPELYHAYTLKEFFYDIWDSDSRSQAENRFNEWLRLIDDPLTQHEFKALAETVTKWRKDIFSYFDTPYTNALTESLNSLTRHIDDVGRGYTYEVLRVKVLFRKEAQKLDKEKVKKKEFREGTFFFDSDTEDYSYLRYTFGSDISTLSQLLDEDKF